MMPKVSAERAVPRRLRFNHSMQSRGFTLVELLVSLGIIAVLIGLILPALSGSMSSARSARCKANLRSLVLGLQAYRDDQRGIIPWATVIPPKIDDPQPFLALASYIGVPLPEGVLGEEVARIEPYACPADRHLSVLTGFSYVYGPSSFMQVTTETGRRSDTINILRLYTEPQYFGNNLIHPHGFPVFQDYLRFHLARDRWEDHRSPDQTGHNLAFLDGSVQSGGDWTHTQRSSTDQ